MFCISVFFIFGLLSKKDMNETAENYTDILPEKQIIGPGRILNIVEEPIEVGTIDIDDTVNLEEYYEIINDTRK